MSDVAVPASRKETSQSMLRVWMAISAVWVAFWFLLAGLVLSTMDFGDRILWEPRPLALIVALPPISLLMAGTICRYLYVGLFPGTPGGRTAHVHSAEH